MILWSCTTEITAMANNWETIPTGPYFPKRLFPVSRGKVRYNQGKLLGEGSDSLYLDYKWTHSWSLDSDFANERENPYYLPPLVHRIPLHGSYIDAYDLMPNFETQRDKYKHTSSSDKQWEYLDYHSTWKTVKGPFMINGTNWDNIPSMANLRFGVKNSKYYFMGLMPPTIKSGGYDNKVTGLAYTSSARHNVSSKGTAAKNPSGEWGWEYTCEYEMFLDPLQKENKLSMFAAWEMVDINDPGVDLYGTNLKQFGTW